MSSTHNPRQLAGSTAAFLTGASVTLSSVRYVAEGLWGELPMVGWGLALAAGALLSARRLPALPVVVAVQGIMASVFVTQTFSLLRFGALNTIGDNVLPALLALCGIGLGYPLLANARTEGAFLPMRYRRLLLVGALALTACVVTETTSATYFLLRGVVEGKASLAPYGSLHGLLAVVQAASVIGILRMRGFAVLTGLGATALVAALAVTSHATWLIPQLACAVVGLLAWVIPLLPDVSKPAVRVSPSEPVRIDAEDADGVIETSEAARYSSATR